MDLSRSLPARTAGVLLLVVGLAGCFTGERPEFEDEQSQGPSTGSAEIDEVLALLESVDRSEFTAAFQIDTKFGTLRSTAEVTQSTGERRSVTVQNDSVFVRFVDDGDDERTCDLSTAECETSLNDARMSNTQLSHEFYGPSFARRLRVSADRRIGPPTTSTVTVVGQQATCVDVPVSGGTETYCALDSGVLARFSGADVTIELTAYSPAPDDTLFET